MVYQLEPEIAHYGHNPEMQAHISMAISLKRIADDLSFVKKVIQIVAAETAPTDDETITRIVRLIKAL